VPRKSKIKSSSYTITGYMTEEQRPAAFAKMKERGTYDPRRDPGSRLSRTGSASKEEKQWLRYIAMGEKGLTPWEKKQIQLKHKKGPISVTSQPGFIGSEGDCDTWHGQKIAIPGGIVDRYGYMKEIVKSYHKQRGTKMPKDGTASFKKDMLLMHKLSEYRDSHSQEIYNAAVEMAEKKGITYRKADDILSTKIAKELNRGLSKGITIKGKKPVSEMTDREISKMVEGMSESEQRHEYQRFMDSLRKNPEKDQPVKIKVKGKWYDTSMANFDLKMKELGEQQIDDIVFSSIPGAKASTLDELVNMMEGKTKIKELAKIDDEWKKRSKEEWRASVAAKVGSKKLAEQVKKETRERRRRQKLEEQRIRAEKIERRKIKRELKSAREKTKKGSDFPSIALPDIAQETPMQKIRREQQEAEAKKEAKKAKKKIRYQKKGKKGFFNL